MTVRFALTSAQRMNWLTDPQGHAESETIDRSPGERSDTRELTPRTACAHAGYVLEPGEILPRRALGQNRCRVRRCMLSRRAVSETLRLHIS